MYSVSVALVFNPFVLYVNHTRNPQCSAAIKSCMNEYFCITFNGEPKKYCLFFYFRANIAIHLL